MSQFHPNITAESLTDKVIVITGLNPNPNLQSIP